MASIITISDWQITFSTLGKIIKWAIWMICRHSRLWLVGCSTAMKNSNGFEGFYDVLCENLWSLWRFKFLFVPIQVLNSFPINKNGINKGSAKLTLAPIYE